MTVKRAFPKEMAGLVAAGFEWMLFDDPLDVKHFQTGREAVVRTSARIQNRAGEEITVLVHAVLTFGEPQPAS